ncbi:hypothetical protein FNP_1096 [Fusobacterium polymorphum ATCC 10953]|uniref:Uncharacterized protein n=1 Tax=Fusobacterium polymorphum ATCC 10953 TaxID=393480 RepID=A5TVF8_FUSNP|nr:hypothetical protein FNP_1096 [Fusobacterium polymorphum ATCC 10953]
MYSIRQNYVRKKIGFYSIEIQLLQIFSIIIVPIQTNLYPKMMSLYRENYEKDINFYLKSNFLVI